MEELNNKTEDKKVIDTQIHKEFVPVKGGYAIAAAAVLAGFLYTLCFAGFYVFSGISSLLFSNAMSLILFMVLNHLKLIKNKKAFLLAVPIFILSLYNSYFEYSYYNTFNYMAFLILYIFMAIYAVKDRADKHRFISLLFNHCLENTVKTVKSLGGGSLKNIKKIALGAVISIPFLIVIALLLISGDKAFSDAVSSVFDFESFDLLGIIWKAIVFVFVSVYSCGFYVCASNQGRERNRINAPRTDSAISISFLTPVNLLFLFFCISQLSYVKSSAEVAEFTTYAEYVHEAFFQLLLVTFINFAIILVFTEFLRDLHNKLLRFSLIMLCVFTFILILSTYYRMYIYIVKYGFTPLRIEVLTFLAIETLLVFIAIWAISRQRVNIIHHFVFWGIAGLFVLNITARPEFSADINENIKLQSYDYMDLSYYEHSCIPLLIEKYDKEENAEKRSEIKNQINYLVTDSRNGFDDEDENNWQSFSIQRERNNRLGKEFMEKH